MRRWSGVSFGQGHLSHRRSNKLGGKSVGKSVMVIIGSGGKVRVGCGVLVSCLGVLVLIGSHKVAVDCAGRGVKVGVDWNVGNVKIGVDCAGRSVLVSGALVAAGFFTCFGVLVIAGVGSVGVFLFLGVRVAI